MTARFTARSAHARTRTRHFGEHKRTKNTHSFQNKPCSDHSSVYEGAYVQERVCYLSRGPLPFLVVPPMISSSCQCMYFLDRPWQPPLRARATSNGWRNKSNRRENNCQQLVSNRRLDVFTGDVRGRKRAPARARTFVEFLLGAVRGQSGSVGFRQGLSM